MSNLYNRLANVSWLLKRKLSSFFFIYITRDREHQKEERMIKWEDKSVLLRYMDFPIVKELCDGEGYRKYLNNLDKNSLVFDIGANIGIFTLQVAEKVKKVISVEPNLDSLNILRRNIALNNIKNVCVLNGAIARNNSIMTLYGEGGGAGFFSKGQGNSVKTYNLDYITNKINKIDLIKIDIEGAEQELIESSPQTLKKTNQIIMEVHKWISSEEKIVKILKNNNFDVQVIKIKGKPMERAVMVYGVRR